MAPARFTGTTVYAGEARRNGQVVHVAGYENTVQNVSGPRGWLRRMPDWLVGQATGNAMILHFPAAPGSMTQANVVDTEACPRILADMVRALAPPVAADGMLSRTTSQPVEVFEHGIYTVALASDVRDIPATLERIPERRRPALNLSLFDWYHATFPGWPVALCCFDTADRAKATPMLWWYEPAYPDWLFAPGVDSHTGDIPDLDAEVAVDHWVVFGSDAGAQVRYRDELPGEAASLLPERVVGTRIHQRMQNADFVTPIAAVRSGSASLERRLLVDVA